MAAEGVEGMASFMKDDENLCDFSKFNNCKNAPTRWVHDKRKIRWIHNDARILEVVNRELKIVRAAVGTAGNLSIAAAVGGRVATRAYRGKQLKIGQKTGIALVGVGASLAVIDGLMGIVDAATAEVQQERCTGCGKTFNTAGCMAMCIADGGCGGKCYGNIWKDAKPTKVVCEDTNTVINGCYHICDSCYRKLVG